MTAEPQRSIRLNLLASPQAVGSFATHASPSRSRGAIAYVTRKLPAISTPAIQKIHILWRERLTNQGAAESRDATADPMPNRTNTDGRAQQISVLNELKSEK